MPLTPEQLTKLVNVVASTTTRDSSDCDNCHDLIAEYAEAHLAGKEIPEAMAVVQIHLANCPCCQVEFQTLLEALRELVEQ